MLRRPFDQQQRQLQDKVLVLASQVEETLQSAIAALKTQDKEQARRLLDGDAKLFQSRACIESDTLALMSTQQPMAGDLRFLAAVFQISLELAGITRHAREIAQISLKLEGRSHPEPFANIVHMAGLVTKMLHQAMEAFAERDIALAQAISVRDDEIDDLDAYINQRLLAVSRANPDVAGHAIYLSQISHLLERVADRATNICEWVIYAVTGHMVEMNVEINFDDQDGSQISVSRLDV